MVSAEGFEAWVQPHGDEFDRYEEYSVPVDSASYTGDVNEVFIEVETGERFNVGAKIIADTHYQDPHVQFSCSLNGHAPTYVYGAASVLQESADTPWLYPVWDRIETLVNGNYKAYSFRFRSLETDHSATVDVDMETREAGHRGTIIVEMTRGTAEMFTLLDPTDQVYNTMDNFHAARKEVVESGQLSHTLEYVELEAPELNNYRYVWTPASGPAGKPVRFTIRYRSRTALQLLKIIPEDEAHGHDRLLTPFSSTDRTIPRPTSRASDADDGSTAAATNPGHEQATADNGITGQDEDDEVVFVESRTGSMQARGSPQPKIEEDTSRRAGRSSTLKRESSPSSEFDIETKADVLMHRARRMAEKQSMVEELELERGILAQQRELEILRKQREIDALDATNPRKAELELERDILVKRRKLEMLRKQREIDALNDTDLEE